MQQLRRVEGLTPHAACVALAGLAQRVPAGEAIVELGVYRARTALYLAWGARRGERAHVWGIDPWDLPGDRGPFNQNPAGERGGHRAAFTSPQGMAKAQRNVDRAGFADGVTLVRAFSAEAGLGWHGPRVGLLFIDGDHHYEAVRADVRAWAPHLAEGAPVVFDDYAASHPEVVQAVDDMAAEGVLQPVRVLHGRLAATALVA